MLQWARQQPSLRIVADQVSNPTWARMLAEITALLLARASVGPAGEAPLVRLPVSQGASTPGLYHLAGDGYASRFTWAQEILRLDPHPENQSAGELLPARTADFPTPATRPLFSALDCSRFTRTFGLRLPPWQAALALAMETL